MKLKEIRGQIDKLDSRLLDLLNERVEKVLKVAQLKRKEGEAYYSPGRERIIVDRLIKQNRGPLPNDVIKEIIQIILRASLYLERKLKIAYFGPPATFTHLAALKNFGKQADFIPARSIGEIFAQVEKRKVDYGVVPVENSTEGVVSHTLDMFLDSELKICAEIILEIFHHLLGKGKLKDVKKVYSHPQALAQCRVWLEGNLPTAKIREAESTAKAAQLAAEEDDVAAIASEVAASLYGLGVLSAHIEDRSQNYTRFLVIGREYTEKSGQDKTSILFSIKDRVGALYDILLPFRKYKLNLTKIESRPTKRKAWEYVFFVDFMGHKDDEMVKKALAELEEGCFFLKVLGSYPKAD